VTNKEANPKKVGEFKNCVEKKGEYGAP